MLSWQLTLTLVAHFILTEASINLLQLSAFISPTSCNTTTQYYDSSSLSCKNCPLNTISTDNFNCKCINTYYFQLNNGGDSIICLPCPQNFIQSFDGSYCVLCDTSCQNCGKKNKNAYLTEFSQDGKRLTDANSNPIRTCIECNQTDSILSATDTCSTCKSGIFSPKISPHKIACSSLIDSGGQFFYENPSQVPNSFNANFDEKPVSWFFKEYLQSSFTTCSLKSASNATACQAIANMCVLGLYMIEIDKSKINACNVYFESIKQPVIKFDNSYAEYRSQYLLNGIEGKFIRLDKRDNSESFYIAEYASSGRLISFKKTSLDSLMQCKSIFGESIEKKCSVSVENLLRFVKFIGDTRFYELFLSTNNELGNNTMLPIAVRIINNDNKLGKDLLYKRFFLFDGVSSKPGRDIEPIYIRYAKSIKIYYELMVNTSNGLIYPPVMLLEYDHVKVKDNSGRKLEMEFDTEFRVDFKIQSRNLWISVGVLLFFGLVWSSVRTWCWNKRSGKYACDLVGLFKFFMFFFGAIGNSFSLGLIGSTFYFFLLHFTQVETIVILPSPSQEKDFTILIILSFCLKLIDVLNTILVQVSYDIFFIDWERPSNQQIAKRNNQAHQVSCWRKIFVANEWNELQTIRKTNITFQLLVSLFLLEYIDLQRYSTSEQANYSRVLRVAVGSLVYIAIGVFQWLYHTIIYTRFVNDQIGKFIDFCSISNISVFILTHNQFGYYIHGKSPHGNADSSMSEMIRSLTHESNNLTTTRGLEANSDHQTFSVLTTWKLSRQYGMTMRPLIESSTAVQNDFTKFEKLMSAYSRLNRFFIAFIEKISRDIPYSVIKRNLFENILDIELKDTQNMSYFFADEEACFTEALFYGCERQFFTFELICFLFIDYFAKSYLLAAFIMYAVNKTLKTFRQDLGKRNVSRKTLVDNRFLL